MDDRPDTAITRHFGDLPDPRIDRTRKHDLIDILSITLCAFLCGADTWEDVTDFGRAKKPWLATFLRLPMRRPCAAICSTRTKACVPLSSIVARSVGRDAAQLPLASVGCWGPAWLQRPGKPLQPRFTSGIGRGVRRPPFK